MPYPSIFCIWPRSLYFWGKLVIGGLFGKKREEKVFLKNFIPFEGHISENRLATHRNHNIKIKMVESLDDIHIILSRYYTNKHKSIISFRDNTSRIFNFNRSIRGWFVKKTPRHGFNRWINVVEGRIRTHTILGCV